VEKGASQVGRRTISLEPGIDYTHISSNRLDITGFSVLPNLVVGLIQVQKIRRDILVPSLTIRAGVTDAFEMNVRIPYSFRYDRVTIGSDSDEGGAQDHKVDENGVGDIEGGFLIHLMKEKGSRPHMMLGLKVKSRTGKDPYGLAFQEIQGNGGPGRGLFQPQLFPSPEEGYPYAGVRNGRPERQRQCQLRHGLRPQ
jgi:hypothetical protein